MTTPQPVATGPDRWPAAERPAPGNAGQTPPTRPGPTATAPDPWRSAAQGYTATDIGSGVTVDSLQAWRDERADFGTFVRADLADIYGSAGPPYVGRPGAQPAVPNLVLTDDAGRTLALNGTPCGFDGEGPRGAARILVQEGLMTNQVARARITTARQLTVHRPAAEPTPEALPDAIALDPARLQAWSSQQRWQSACNAVDPRLVDDPHYPALAAALDRIEAAGTDARVALIQAGGDSPLPEANPGRDLHRRLIMICDAAVTPAPPPAPGPPPAPSASPTAPGLPAAARSAPRM